MTVAVARFELHLVPALGSTGSVMVDGSVRVRLQVTGHDVKVHSATGLRAQDGTTTTTAR